MNSTGKWGNTFANKWVFGLSAIQPFLSGWKFKHLIKIYSISKANKSLVVEQLQFIFKFTGQNIYHKKYLLDKIQRLWRAIQGCPACKSTVSYLFQLFPLRIYKLASFTFSFQLVFYGDEIFCTRASWKLSLLAIFVTWPQWHFHLPTTFIHHNFYPPSDQYDLRPLDTRVEVGGDGHHVSLSHCSSISQVSFLIDHSLKLKSLILIKQIIIYTFL